MGVEMSDSIPTGNQASASERLRAAARAEKQLLRGEQAAERSLLRARARLERAKTALSKASERYERRLDKVTEAKERLMESQQARMIGPDASIVAQGAEPINGAHPLNEQASKHASEEGAATKRARRTEQRRPT
jgi:hypothetical protein